MHQRTSALLLASALAATSITNALAAGQTAPLPPIPPTPDAPATATPAAPAAAAPAAAAPAPPTFKLGENTTVAISTRARVESWDWFEGAQGDGNYTFLGNLLRLGITHTRPRQEFQIELAQPSLVGLPEDAVAPAPLGQLGLGGSYFAANGEENAFGLNVKQAFVRFKNLGNVGNSLRLGRFEFADGSEVVPKDATLAWVKRERISNRLIGIFGFSHVQRSFDGVQVVRSTPSSNFTVVASRPTEGVFQVEGNGRVDDVDFLYGAITLPAQSSDARLFAIHYRDRRGVLKTDNRPAPLRQADTEDIGITTVGAHYLRTFDVGGGKADVLVWGALQTGDWGTQDHSANAIAVEAGYQPKSSGLKPWLRAGYYRSSGDNDPADDQHGTFFQLLPTPRQYARFPFYNGMNNEDIFVQAILRPTPKMTLRADAHRLRLNSAQDLWYIGGGAFQDTTFGFNGRPGSGQTELATLFDLSLDYTFNARTSLSLYAGFAPGGNVISAIYPNDDSGRFGFVELTQKF